MVGVMEDWKYPGLAPQSSTLPSFQYSIILISCLNNERWLILNYFSIIKK
jgi:hypothetical protein